MDPHEEEPQGTFVALALLLTTAVGIGTVFFLGGQVIPQWRSNPYLGGPNYLMLLPSLSALIGLIIWWWVKSRRK